MANGAMRLLAGGDARTTRLVAFFGVAAIVVLATWITLAITLGLPRAVTAAGDDALPTVADVKHRGHPTTDLPRIGDYALIASDYVEEPDTLGGYDELDAFVARQGEIATLLRRGGMVTTGDGTRPFVAGTRSILDLPAAFWVTLFSGIGGLGIAVWVWVLRPADVATRHLAMSGIALAVALLPAAIYLTRPLAVEPGLLTVLMMLNHAGSLAFGVALIALFGVFPRRLFGAWGTRATAAVGVAFVGADWARGLGAPHGAYAVYMVMAVIIIGLIGVQAWLVRRDPRDRATLLWVGLSVVTGVGSWAALVLAYWLQGDLGDMPEAYSFACFFLIYLGLALGVARFRLFDVADRAFWVFFYGAGAILFLSADGLLAWGLAVSGDRALMLSLLAVAFLYLPMRDRLWRAFKGLRGSDQSDLFAEVIELVFMPTREKQAEGWRGFLERQFRPVEIRATGEAVAAARIGEDGLELVVPSVTAAQGLVLAYPRRGIGLFSPRDVRLVDRAVALIDRAVSGRDAYERGMLEERRRVARDLHDDVGARLLDALVVADDRTRGPLQEALRDVRSIAHGLNQDDIELEVFLATLRHESINRLEGSGIVLDWPVAAEPLAATVVSARCQRALASLVREALSNTIKHAEASRIEVRLAVSGGTISGHIRDDGRGRRDGVDGTSRPGLGLKGLAARVGELGGRLTVTGDDGVALDFELPLREETGR